jgi:hypothetical protein
MRFSCDWLARYVDLPDPIELSLQLTSAGLAVEQIEKIDSQLGEDTILDIAVTTTPDTRQDPEAVGELLIRSTSGQVVPLKAVAHVYLTDGRTSVSHEGGRQRQVITTNPPPKDAAKVTKAVQAAIASQVRLPPGVYVDYVGTAAGTQAAQRQLLFNVAIALIAVVAVLLITFGDGRAVGLILASAPFALVGGVVAVAPEGRAGVTVVANGRNWATSVVGSTNAWFDTGNWKLAGGRKFEAHELTAGSAVCIVGETVRREIFGGIAGQVAWASNCASSSSRAR